MRIEAAGVTVRFGAVAALSRVDIVVESGERRALIGPNGAGKTTLFNTITGETRAAEGRISIDGRDVTHLASWRRARRGLARTFQRSALFPELTVRENLALALRTRGGSGWRFWPSRSEGVISRAVSERLEAAGLGRVAASRAGAMSHGEQRSLEIEIALAARPRALLLDEPMAGLSGGEREAALERLHSLPRDVTLIIVEHDLDAVFAIADRVTVLDHGVVIADGSATSVRKDPRVQEVYLGV